MNNRKLAKTSLSIDMMFHNVLQNCGFDSNKSANTCY